MSKGQVLFFSVALGITASFVASPLVYQWHFNFEDLSQIVLFPVLVIMLLLLIGLTISNLFNNWKSSFIGVFLFVLLTAIFSTICIQYKNKKDAPAILLEASFDNRESFDLYLRKDMTVKCTEGTLISSIDKYGTYQIRGDTVILESINIEYGFSEVSDTMLIDGNRLMFRLDKEWRNVLESFMYIEKNTL